MRSPPKRPVRGLMAYLIPFIFIITLLAAIVVILDKNVGLEDLLQIFDLKSVNREDRAMAVYAEGEVLVKRWSEEEERLLSAPSELEPGDRVRTGKDGLLVIRLFEGSELRLDKHSELTIVQLDRNEADGHQISLKLDGGKLWRRGFGGNTKNAQFLISSPRLIVSINDPAVLDLDVLENSLHMIGGKAKATILDDVHGKKMALKHLDISSGFEFLGNESTISKLRSGSSVQSSAISDAYFASEWYQWNIEKEEALGLITILPKPEPAKIVNLELPALEAGLVTVTFPADGTKTAGKLLVSGTYSKEKIEKIFVNDEEAVLGLENEWEAGLTVTEANAVITVTAIEKSATEKKLATRITLVVDVTGPVLGKIIQPEIDANGNGVLTGDRLELIGEVGTDAKKICISYQEDEPFCLKQWKPGDKTYKYYGAIKFGNVVKGKNKYTIMAYDDLENASSKTVYLFKDVPKPEAKLPESAISAPETVSVESTPSSTEFPKPVILIPDPTSTTQTYEKAVLINGTVDSRARSILLNGKKAPYTVGSGTFNILYDLELGENLIKIQAVNDKGEKSKPALLTVIYIEKAIPASPLPTP